ncbi:beta-N-acetylhexosaminidase [Raineyella antarctica]|uniref:beta-N-acetylhexosaminidase n=1 Tax=Raineyella antarctica TaxID=1577474 RepID=A0A1G6GE24_9ACTN|nr:glycoside hydrolase family 3 N-terminal domain-containing protein [Raineyella antarctica]SDB80248.1 beta-N-acetylhexosaminidase [Raineyella antarctica]
MSLPRTPLRHRTVLAAGLAVLALSLAACGPRSATPTASATAGPGSTTAPTATTTPAPASTPGSTGPDGVPPVIRADSCRLRVDAMTPAERAGQLVMVGHQVGEDPAATAALVKRQDLGSVILMGTSKAGVTSVRQMTDAIRAGAGRDGLVVAVDQEGGQVRRLSGTGFTAMPSAADQGKLSTTRLADDARTWGKELHRAGIDVDLAPVADVVPADRVAVNEPIARYGRGFGSDPAAVSGSVRAFVSGLRSGGTGTAVKHFPGLGQVVGNTDFATGVTDDRTVRHDPLLAPFGAAIGAGTDMVMISSARYTRIDAQQPALWSPVVIGQMLRGDLGWHGVVVSDDLGVAAQVQSVAPGERAVRFVRAGGDIAITVDPTLADDMVTGLADTAAHDPAFDRQVRDSALRVLEMKAGRGLAGCSAG